MKQQALEAFKATVTVFEDQLKLHVTFRSQALPHEMNKYVVNCRYPICLVSLLILMW